MTDNQGRPKLDQAIETVLNLIQKQNKVIDEMAELIARKVGTRTEICHNMNCDKSTEKACKQCAIEYFINKAVEKI